MSSESNRRRLPVSAVVAVRNRAGVIGRCLAALEDARPLEIIVVDGRSSDGTAKLAEELGARVISDQGAGLAVARNLGARAAASHWIVYVDSDAVVEPDTIRALLREAEELDLDAVQAQLLPISDDSSYWQRGEAWRRRNREKPGLARAIGCQATLVRRDIVVDPGFDPLFNGAGEDGDFFTRACTNGARVAFSGRAVAHHEDRRSARAFIEQRIWHGRGLARSAVRNPKRYGSAVTEEGSSAGPRILRTPEYLPFMAVSMWALAVGFGLELAGLAVRPKVRESLRRAATVETGFGVLSRRPPLGNAPDS